MCGVGVVVPKEQDAGVEVPPPEAAAAATVEVDAASQASEPASQASDEEDGPSTDIYFVWDPSKPGLVMPCGLSASVYCHWKDVPTHECLVATIT